MFAIQHTIMARLAFKRWWTRIVSPAIERSVFVLVSSLILIAMVGLWRPLPGVVWHVEGSAGRMLLSAISFLGWGIVLYATFLINHFDLFGLRQVWLYSKGREYSQVVFRESVLYRWVRHPLMFGFIVALRAPFRQPGPA